ncbi:MAG: rRNA cytosine-C5-methyltransferase [Paludibacter sp.]|nr:rRNA cytosine-C5-methyltransferase [Paludibacter sp.]
MKLPDLFIQRTRSLLETSYLDLEKALEDPSPVSVRVNNKKANYCPSDRKVLWCDDGYYLDERPLFTADPLFHAGVYYVQEASSMFLQQIVQMFFSRAETVLDLCAAPGGKTTLLAQNLPEGSLLVSNEINRSRAMILAENVIKWGNPNVIVTNESPASFKKLPGFFDAIIVDAPCSGEGMFRKDPGSIEEWSIQNVQQCVIRQKNILEEAWDSLKPEGILVYSTCTYNREENEENIQWACDHLGAELLRPEIDAFEGIVQSDYGLRFYPHRIEGEGFFISVLKKTDENTSQIRIKEDKKLLKVNKSVDYCAKVMHPEAYEIIETNQQLTAYAKKHIAKSFFISKELNCLVNGVTLFDIKGKDIVPHPQFALSKIINPLAFNKVDVDLSTAISFLRKENVFLSDAPKGYLLITYQHQPLGWVKNLGNRCNNLYPQHWRIRMHL